MIKCFSIMILSLCVGISMPPQTVYRLYEGPAPGSENADYPEIVLPNEIGKPRVLNVTVPTLTVYSPEESINTGAAVIIAPGGGNVYLTWEEEGVNVAQWFQRHGVTGIILKYRTSYMGKNEEEIQKSLDAFFRRVPTSDGAASRPAQRLVGKMEPTMAGDDGRAAVRFVRTHAEELGIDPGHVGLIGFSAGAGLTCNVMYINDEESRPGFLGPIYGVFSEGDLPANPVPTFLAAPEFDFSGPQAAIHLYEKFQQAKLPCELHFIYDAVHGLDVIPGWGFCVPTKSLYDAFVAEEGEDGYRLSSTIKTPLQLEKEYGLRLKSGIVHSNEGLFNWKFAVHRYTNTVYGFKERNKVLPIPANELMVNPNLKQNPGW